MNNGIDTIATGVPISVDALMQADGCASGKVALMDGGPEMSEPDAALMDINTTPPAEKPVR